ncbi:cytochrome P450 [Crepidotus variabilis]|uniref:Cytochrome P450 n=1 Tax=Crepidotus variabilis TaxID=179855 RepID=A0A9P6JQ31_9AGAR|nr:cytochrome P450 [Crepidotus variabilis]
MDGTLPLQLPLLSPIVGLATFAFVCYSYAQKTPKYPPGPPRLPLIGNAHQVPTKKNWLKFTEWAGTYGDLVHLDALGQHIFIANSEKVANDLLEKKSSISSDRPIVQMHHLSGFDKALPLRSYGDSFKKQRRFLATEFSPVAIQKYHSLYDKEARLLIQLFVQSPDSVWSDLRLGLGKVILLTTYGYQPKSTNDTFLMTNLSSLENFLAFSTPGKYLVDAIPFLKYAPRWLPGSGFLKVIDQSQNLLQSALRGPFQWWKNRCQSGEHIGPNLCSSVLEKAGGQLSPPEEENLLWAAHVALGGGLDTNVSFLSTFFLCMVLNPDVQTKAKAEIDLITGGDRLPNIQDKASLPYIRSIMAEVLRWSPPAPTAFPHVTTRDDMYEGFSIPKGSIIFPNVWNIMHDPARYPDPTAFKPERFDGDDSKMSQVNIAFGYGRRVCPGQHIASSYLFAIVATVLATCEIAPGLNEEGQPMIPQIDYSESIISIQKPFGIRFVPRCPQARDLLIETEICL